MRLLRSVVCRRDASHVLLQQETITWFAGAAPEFLPDEPGGIASAPLRSLDAMAQVATRPLQRTYPFLLTGSSRTQRAISHSYHR